MSSDNPTALGGPAAEPKSPLTLRLAGLVFAVSILLVGIASGILYKATTAALRDADDQVVEKRMEAVLQHLQEPKLDLGEIAHEVSEDNQGPRQIFIRVQSSALPLFETPSMEKKLPPDLFPDVTSAPLMSRQQQTIVSKTGQTYRVMAVRVPVTGPGEAVLHVATDTSLDDAGLAVFRRALWMVLGAAVPMCALASWLLVRRELQPLQRITAAADVIDSSTLNYRLPLTDLPAELHTLASQFNQMLSRLEATCNGLRQYADNLAHELRTPLNRMRLESELALRHSRSIDEYQAVMAANVEECESLSRLLQGLLFLARAENNQAGLSRQPVHIGQMLDAMRDYFEAGAEAAGVTLTCSATGDYIIEADKDLLQRAIANLVSNALAHTPKGGNISVRASQDGNQLAIVVEDNGEGIAEEFHARLFDRYFRIGQGNAVGDRLGLGLPITKSIVDLHGGTISVASTKGQGTKFTIVLPAVSAITTAAAE